MDSGTGSCFEAASAWAKALREMDVRARALEVMRASRRAFHGRRTEDGLDCVEVYLKIGSKWKGEMEPPVLEEIRGGVLRLRRENALRLSTETIPEWHDDLMVAEDGEDPEAEGPS